MAPASHLGQVAAALLVSATVLAGVSCGESARSLDGPIALEVVLEAGQRWTAAERGALCERGTRHVIRAIDPATAETVPIRVWSRVLDDAITHRNSTEITFVVENTCADGSGSFVTIEQWGPEAWSVDSGTGAYRDLHGGGALSFTTADYMQTRPLRLVLDGVLEG